MTRPIHALYCFGLFIALFAPGCGDDDDPPIPNEEELITDLIYTLTPTGAGGQAVTLTFTDRDGDGGNPPVVTISDSLAANTEYAGVVQLLNASDPADVENITLEVAEENTEHQFFYRTDSSLDLTVAYDDEDVDGQPLGILTTVSTGNASAGTMTIILRHEPDKTAAGLTIDNPTPGGGETDIEVEFDLAIR